jgi:pilus assembly protein CpaB
MNRSRILILGLAAFAAIVAAFLVRGLLGGGTTKSAAATPPQPLATEQVLVASAAIQPGTKLTAGSVHWQVWPKSAVDGSFITSASSPDIDKIVAGTVARTPIAQGEPLSVTKIVHADSAGFMAAQLSAGTRAVSISIDEKASAGGFILPNDRVDVLLTRSLGDHQFDADTILKNVRVLAVGQSYEQKQDEKVVEGKTATLELTPGQAEVIARASEAGTLSLSLRPLDDSGPVAAATDDGGPVNVIRYGIARSGLDKSGE